MEAKYVLILNITLAVLSVTAVQAYATSAQSGIGHMGGGRQMNGSGRMGNMMNGHSMVRQHMNTRMINDDPCSQYMRTFRQYMTEQC